MDCSPWNSPGQNTRVGSLSLLQGVFPTQGSNPGLPHRRRILYQLNHQGRTLTTWLVSAAPFSSVFLPFLEGTRLILGLLSFPLTAPDLVLAHSWPSLSTSLLFV